jgi:hypothetical protein
MSGQASAHDISGYLKLLKEAAVGHFDGLQCPTCAESSVSAWFTNPAEDTYRTWFLCSSCNFHSRAQNAEKPPFYSEDRVRKDLEQLDRENFEKALFKRPARDT